MHPIKKGKAALPQEFLFLDQPLQVEKFQWQLGFLSYFIEIWSYSFTKKKTTIFKPKSKNQLDFQAQRYFINIQLK